MDCGRGAVRVCLSVTRTSCVLAHTSTVRSRARTTRGSKGPQAAHPVTAADPPPPAPPVALEALRALHGAHSMQEVQAACWTEGAQAWASTQEGARHRSSAHTPSHKSSIQAAYICPRSASHNAHGEGVGQQVHAPTKTRQHVARMYLSPPPSFPSPRLPGCPHKSDAVGEINVPP